MMVLQQVGGHLLPYAPRGRRAAGCAGGWSFQEALAVRCHPVAEVGIATKVSLLT